MADPPQAMDPAAPLPSTLPRLLLDACDRYGGAPAFGRITGDLEVEPFSHLDFLRAARRVAGGLDALGLERGDRAAILSETRLEWMLADFGCLAAGVVDVPVYPSLEAAQVAYILRDSGARLLFVSDARQMTKALEAREECGHPVEIVVFDPPEVLPGGVHRWDDFLEDGGRRAEEAPVEEFRRRALEAEPDDVATLLYTSGTTGEPKGVMLTHGNVSSNVVALGTRFSLDGRDVTVSFLPLSHILQRTVDYLFLVNGCTVVHARSMASATKDMQAVRPTVVVAVPRIYEKMYQALLSASGPRERLVGWAVRVAEAAADARLAGEPLRGTLALRYAVADRLVYAKVRAAVGGRLRFFISGAAPLSPALSRFFRSIGITILEGYGLTETSPVVSVNTEEELRMGTVGRVLPGTELRIADDGEILVRGPQVMKGYHGRPQETGAALDDEGWLRTGDIGEVDADGFLRITDRKKDLIVTAGGKNVAPALVEGRLTGCRAVEASVMIGDGRKYCILLVVPSFPHMEAWARDRGLTWPDRGGLVRHPDVRAWMEGEVRAQLAGLASYETPKKIVLLDEEFTVENGILTPSLKVKRKVVQERFRSAIDGAYAGRAPEA